MTSVTIAGACVGAGANRLGGHGARIVASGPMSSVQRPLLRLGAAFDAAFALPMLLAPGPASRLLRIALPADLTWFRLCAVLLLIAAGCYSAASLADDAGVRRTAIVSGCGRLLGCLVLVTSGAGAAVVAT